MDLYRMSNGGCDCSRQWLDESRARKYWDSARENQQSRIRQTLSALDIGPESNVLDIGSGPGVLSLPMAGKAASVTAVDASPAMIRVLREKAEEAGLENIRCLAAKWEDVDPERDLSPPYDVAVASLALGMPDLDAALDKMERVCSGEIHLIWFAGEPTWENKAGLFKRRFCGRPHFPSPKSDVVFNLLYQRGIYPCIHVIPYTHEERFASLDDAVAYFVRRYQIPWENRGPDLLECVEGLLDGQAGKPVLRSRAVLMRMSWRAGIRNGAA
jgi:ubiquinone/menaquinone biosynthesis C-methylase UbiE